jgi:hypothetical protein
MSLFVAPAPEASKMTPLAVLPSAAVPAAFVPMKLPRTRLLEEANSARMPSPPLPLMTLRSAAVVPPIWLEFEPLR